jgi:hypothetical protein
MSGTLSHTPAQVIRQLMIDLGLGANGGLVWPIYAEESPDKPDNCITVRTTGEVSQGRFQIGGEEQTAYSLQIIVRALHHQLGATKVNAIKVTLSQSVQLTNTTVTDDESSGTATQTYTVYSISRRSGPFFLSAPPSDRKLWSYNIQATLTQAQ